jgi:hypothetical protein
MEQSHRKNRYKHGRFVTIHEYSKLERFHEGKFRL